MSRWTHVAGLIRVDAVPFLHNAPPLYKIQELAEKDIPRGSEGPLQVEVIQALTPEGWEFPKVMNYATIIIEGDLRDFGDADEVKSVIRWFTHVVEVLAKRQLLVRQAVISINDEYNENSKVAFIYTNTHHEYAVKVLDANTPEEEISESDLL